MSGKIKNRSGANADLTSGGVSCDERILRDCHQLYADPESGELSLERRHPAGLRETWRPGERRHRQSSVGRGGDCSSVFVLHGELMFVPTWLTITEMEGFPQADQTISSSVSVGSTGKPGAQRGLAALNYRLVGGEGSHSLVPFGLAYQ